MREMAVGDGAILLCGRYEGIDQRFLDRHVDLELSLGDFVLSGGELPALALLDGVTRLQPGVLHDARSMSRTASRMGCWTARTTAGPRCCTPRRAICRCRPCCCPATMPRSSAGAASVRWN
jgi:hypothetical protein